MAASKPIPVLLCGKIPTHVKATSDIVKPEYEVVKVCSDVETATETVSGLMSPSAAAGATLAKPRVIIMGGGYSHEEFLALYETVEGAKDVPWIRPIGTKPGHGGPPAGGPPPAEDVAKRLRKVLDDHSADIESNSGAGQIWYM